MKKNPEITMVVEGKNVVYVPKEDVIEKTVGPEVIVRTYSAGVHIGTIKSREGQEVVLVNARRLWSWRGAFTLNVVATEGVDRKNSRISKSVPEITLLQAIEIIPVLEGVDLSTTEN